VTSGLARDSRSAKARAVAGQCGKSKDFNGF